LKFFSTLSAGFALLFFFTLSSNSRTNNMAISSEKETHSYEGEGIEKVYSQPHKVVLDTRSPGVRKIEAISSSFTTTSLTILFIGIFLASYAYGLDGSTRSVYQVGMMNI
jgi:hypothetical protein